MIVRLESLARSVERASPLCRVRAAMVVAFGIVVLSYPGSARSDETPSAAEVLAKSKAAMGQPLKYRLSTGGAEMEVYQKVMPDGTTATLFDMSKPIKKITITRGDSSYDLFMDQRIAIDMRAILGGATKAAALMSKLGDRPGSTDRLTGTARRGGEDCYVIETSLSKEARDAFSKMAPAISGSLLPSITRQLINRRTWLVVETEALSANGASLSKIEHKDITPQPDLTDDFFTIPANFEVKKPESAAQYMNLVARLMMGELPPGQDGFQPPAPRLPPAVAPIAKAPKLNVAFTPGQATEGVGPTGPNPISPLRLVVLVAALVVPLGIVAVMAIRRSRKD